MQLKAPSTTMRGNEQAELPGPSLVLKRYTMRNKIVFQNTTGNCQKIKEYSKVTTEDKAGSQRAMRALKPASETRGIS